MKSRLLASLLLLSTTGACALFSKSEPMRPRYFDPQVEAAGASATVAAPAATGLRLGRITASDALGERIRYRSSGVEVGYYEDRLWSERPEDYLRRELSRALFEARGVQDLTRGPGASLDMELTHFEEVKGSNHLARVGVALALTQPDGRSVRRTLSVEVPITESGDEPAAVAQAIGAALRQVIDQAAELVVATLEKANPGQSTSSAP